MVHTPTPNCRCKLPVGGDSHPCGRLGAKDYRSSHTATANMCPQNSYPYSIFCWGVLQCQLYYGSASRAQARSSFVAPARPLPPADSNQVTCCCQHSPENVRGKILTPSGTLQKQFVVTPLVDYNELPHSFPHRECLEHLLSRPAQRQSMNSEAECGMRQGTNR